MRLKLTRKLARRVWLFLACTLACTARIAHADFPEKTITLIVPWAAGGSTDILARALSEQWIKQLGLK